MKKIIITILVALFTVLSTNYIYADGYTFTWIHADVEKHTFTKIEEVINYVNHPDTDNKIRHIVEIILTSDVDLKKADTLVIPSGTSIELDLNGHDFTNSSLPANKPLITNEGVLVIKDTNIGNGVVSISGAAPVILNKGIFDLESGTLKNQNHTVIVNGEDNLTKSAEVYINGGLIITQTDYAIIQHGFSNEYDSSIRINGGKFISNQYIITTEKADDNYKTSIYIDGGEFAKTLNVTSTNCVRNASFKEEPDSSLCAEKFKVKKVNNDFVVTTDYVAKVNDNYYSDLYTAFIQSRTGDTIVVLKDCEDDNSVQLRSGTGFDLNGHNVIVKEFITCGTYFDSSEIINTDQQYYCRPQGSIKMTGKVRQAGEYVENLFTEINTYRGVDSNKNPFAVLINGVYKFYTLTDYYYNVPEEPTKENATAEFRFAPVIGFRGNIACKEIFSSSSNIRVGFYMKTNSDFVSIVSSTGLSFDGLGSVGNSKRFAVYDVTNTNSFANNNGMGTFKVFTSYRHVSDIDFVLIPFIYDTKNKLKRESTKQPYPKKTIIGTQH